MGDIVTLDVVDRPSGGALRALRALHRAGPPEGCRGLVPCTTSEFAKTWYPVMTPRRIAVVAAWDSADAVDGSSPVPAIARDAREHWHVRGELARSSHTAPWHGWVPDASGNPPLRRDDPLLVLISGELRARHVPVFMRDAVRSSLQARRHPGYLGGLAVFSSPLNTTSVSAWRTAMDSREYAFLSGAHAVAMKRDVDGEHHRTERFLRIRPVATYGTLAGSNPFAGVVPELAPAG